MASAASGSDAVSCIGWLCERSNCHLSSGWPVNRSNDRTETVLMLSRRNEAAGELCEQADYPSLRFPFFRFFPNSRSLSVSLCFSVSVGSSLERERNVPLCPLFLPVYTLQSKPERPPRRPTMPTMPTIDRFSCNAEDGKRTQQRPLKERAVASVEVLLQFRKNPLADRAFRCFRDGKGRAAAQQTTIVSSRSTGLMIRCVVRQGIGRESTGNRIACLPRIFPPSCENSFHGSERRAAKTELCDYIPL